MFFQGKNAREILLIFLIGENTDLRYSRSGGNTENPDELFLFLVRGELIFSYAAEGTLEIIGKIFELGSGLDAGLEIAVVLVIDVSANATNKFCHTYSSIENFD